MELRRPLWQRDGCVAVFDHANFFCGGESENRIHIRGETVEVNDAMARVRDSSGAQSVPGGDVCRCWDEYRLKTGFAP